MSKKVEIFNRQYSIRDSWNKIAETEEGHSGSVLTKHGVVSVYQNHEYKHLSLQMSFNFMFYERTFNGKIYKERTIVTLANRFAKEIVEKKSINTELQGLKNSIKALESMKKSLIKDLKTYELAIKKIEEHHKSYSNLYFYFEGKKASKNLHPFGNIVIEALKVAMDPTKEVIVF